MKCLILVALLGGQALPFPIDAPWNNGFQYWIPKRSTSIFIAHPAHTDQICIEDSDRPTLCLIPDLSATLTVVEWGERWPTFVRILVNDTWRYLDTVPGEQG